MKGLVLAINSKYPKIVLSEYHRRNFPFPFIYGALYNFVCWPALHFGKRKIKDTFEITLNYIHGLRKGDSLNQVNHVEQNSQLDYSNTTGSLSKAKYSCR